MSPEQRARPQQEPFDFQPTRAWELLQGGTTEANTPGWQVVRPSQGRENKQISQQRMSQQQAQPRSSECPGHPLPDQPGNRHPARALGWNPFLITTPFWSHSKPQGGRATLAQCQQSPHAPGLSYDHPQGPLATTGNISSNPGSIHNSAIAPLGCPHTVSSIGHLWMPSCGMCPICS